MEMVTTENNSFQNDTDHEMLPPYIRLAYDRIFDVNKHPKDIEYKLWKIEEDGTEVGIASRGEIMPIYGPEKSRKSTLLACIIASAYTDNKDQSLNFRFDLNRDEHILWFDTEMGENFFFRRQAMLTRMCGYEKGENIDNYMATYFRGLPYYEKIEIIDHFIDKRKKQVDIGVIILDQVADLVKDINDRDSVAEFIMYLEKWTQDTKAIIFPAIHVTRGTDYMTGVLGHELGKKMDNSLFCKKQWPSGNTVVKNLLSRGADIKPFEFNNNEYGYPEFINSKY